jgi:hypothetical protein
LGQKATARGEIPLYCNYLANIYSKTTARTTDQYGIISFFLLTLYSLKEEK